MVFRGVASANNQGFIVAEKNILFEITDFSVVRGVICLLATYYTFYVKYPKPIVANSFLLFLQEIVLGSKDVCTRRSSKYTAFINSIL